MKKKPVAFQSASELALEVLHGEVVRFSVGWTNARLPHKSHKSVRFDDCYSTCGTLITPPDTTDRANTRELLSSLFVITLVMTIM